MIDNPYLNELREREVHVVALASVEVSAVADFLHAQGVKKIVAHDCHEGVEFKKAFRKAHAKISRDDQVKALQKIESLPIEKRFGEKYLEGIEEADVIFPSQGWFLYENTQPKLQELKESGVEFGSMMKLYLQLAPANIIGVTGTNGKGTTTHLISDILRESGNKVYLAGNDPHSIQVLDKLESMQASDHLILEISNRQLMIDLGKSPHVAVITNVTPNHLDEHHGLFAEYVKVKESLLKYQTEDDFAVLNFDNETTKNFADNATAQVYGFSTYKSLGAGAMVERDGILFGSGDEKEEICLLEDIVLPGKYNQENVLAALTVAKILGVKNDAIYKTLQNFKGLPRRLEFVKEFAGVRYYNDLFSSTPTSTCRGLEAFDKPIVLIAGGDAKGVDYFDMAECIKQRVKKLYIFPGTVADDLKSHFQKLSFSDFVEMDDLESCLADIKKNAQSGEVVVLSPGGASFGSKFIEGKSKGFNSIVQSW